MGFRAFANTGLTPENASQGELESAGPDHMGTQGLQETQLYQA
jgi:hypothetical protein